MKSVSAFAITTFTNPSGEIVFRVSGYLCGQRVRKNFATRAEAEAENRCSTSRRCKATRTCAPLSPGSRVEQNSTKPRPRSGGWGKAQALAARFGHGSKSIPRSSNGSRRAFGTWPNRIAPRWRRSALAVDRHHLFSDGPPRAPGLR